jgi:hypothetical protein
MASQCRTKSLLVTFFIFSSVEAAAQAVKVPPIVNSQLAEIQDRFAAVLEEECADGACYSVGCEVGRFATLDENQDSSLPGLESETKGVTVPQYKLMSVNCEFAHEPTMDAENVMRIKNRMVQRIKPVGVAVQVRTKKLQAKPLKIEEAAAALPAALRVEPQTWDAGLQKALLPFLPWFLLILFVLLFVIVTIWAVRKLGRVTKSEVQSLLVPNGSPLEKAKGPDAEPSPMMLMTRMAQMRKGLEEDNRLVEFTLRPFFEKENFEELCLFLRHFGPDFLAVFREKSEFREALTKLSNVYNESDGEMSAGQIWKYLDRLDRGIIAAKVKINNEPLEDEFAFLGSLEVDELLGILKDVTDLEAVAAIAYAPRMLREKFFSVAPPQFTSRIVEQLTRVDRLADSFIRETAKKLRTSYNENSQFLKTTQVKKNPLIEVALNSLSGTQRRALIEGLIRENPLAMDDLAPLIFLDETLLYLDDDTLTEVFLEVSPRDAAGYLSNFEWAGQVVEKLKPRVQEPIKKILARAETFDSNVLTVVRGRIADFVRRRQSTGGIDLTAINRQILEG